VSLSEPRELAPEIFTLARRLAHLPGFALLLDAGVRPRAWLAANPVERSERLDPEAGLPLLGTARGKPVPRWIGLLPYEAFRRVELSRGHRETRSAPVFERPLWQRYDALVEITDRVTLHADSRSALARLEHALRTEVAPTPVRLSGLRPADHDQTHAARILRALELIAAGELYEVNLARRFELEVLGTSVDVLQRLSERAPGPQCFILHTPRAEVIATSPETFLSTTAEGRIATFPIKGTRPCGADPAENERRARALDASAKERAELAMVIDVERNDLNRVCDAGSVHLAEPPHVESFGTVLHRLATVEGRLTQGATREAVLQAMMPSGSITGAPKLRAMEVIAQLESHRRGLYTGAFGALMSDGSLELGMAIRTLVRRGDAAHYFAGGGIVADSDAPLEVQETHWKAAQLLEG